MSEESEREEIKDETHQSQDEEQEELDKAEEEEEAKTVEEDGDVEWEEEEYSNNRTIIYNFVEDVHRYRGFNKTIKAQDTACEDAQ